MPKQVHGVLASNVHAKIKLLIDGMVNIQDTTGEFLLTLPDGRVIDTKGWNDWEWTHGIGLYGIWQYYEITADPALLKIIEDWFAARFAEGGTTKNINTMAVFLTLAHVYEHTRNPLYLPHLTAWAEWAYHDLPRTRFRGMQHVTYVSPHTNQLWDDTLMMTVLPLAKIGRVLNRPHYLAEAKRQFLLHIQYLADPKTGLFFHGWEFSDPAAAAASAKTTSMGHNFAEARWARGNSWLTIAIPEFLDLLNADNNNDDDAVLKQYLVDVLEAQVEALAALQTPSGLWRTLLDIPESEGSYVEASATAGFAYGILKARRQRVLDAHVGLGTVEGDDGVRLVAEDKRKKSVYDQVAVKAVKAVLDNIDERGELQNTSFGTAMGMDLQHYKDIPVTSMPYGQAMAIMALVEYLRVFI